MTSEREQIEAWLTSVENRRFGYNGADKTVAGPMRRSLADLDAANARADEAETGRHRTYAAWLRAEARADEAEREVARLRLINSYHRGELTKMELYARLGEPLTPEDTQCPDCEGRGWRPTGDGYGDEVCPTCST